jgi:hypothetical protein
MASWLDGSWPHQAAVSREAVWPICARPRTAWMLAEFNPNTHFLRSCSADRSAATAVRLPSDYPAVDAFADLLVDSTEQLKTQIYFLFRLTPPAEREKIWCTPASIYHLLTVYRHASTADADSPSRSTNCDLKPCSNTTCYHRRRIVYLLKTYNHNTISRFGNTVWRLTSISAGYDYGHSSLFIPQHRQSWALAQAVSPLALVLLSSHHRLKWCGAPHYMEVQATGVWLEYNSYLSTSISPQNPNITQFIHNIPHKYNKLCVTVHSAWEKESNVYMCHRSYLSTIRRVLEWCVASSLHENACT